MAASLDNKLLCIRMRLAATQMLIDGAGLFQRASVMYKQVGLGAMVALFDSEAHMRQCMDDSRFELEYWPLERVGALNYPYGTQLTVTYNPAHTFVLLCGIRNPGPQTSYSFISAIAPPDIADRLRSELLAPPTYLPPDLAALV
jgi:hypothetical protein